MKRLWIALSVYAVLAALAWTTIGDEKFRYATVAVLAMFAVRTWVWNRKRQHEEQHQGDE